MKILIASPIRATPSVLAEFLISLSILDVDDHVVEFCFVDDNLHTLSKRMLSAFLKQFSGQTLSAIENSAPHGPKPSPEVLHQQQQQLIEYARSNHFDRVLLLRCDFLVHPQTISFLTKQEGACELKAIKGATFVPDESFALRNFNAGLWLDPAVEIAISDYLNFREKHLVSRPEQYPLTCIATDYGQTRGWTTWHASFKSDRRRYEAVRLATGVGLLSSHLYLEGPSPELQSYISPQLWSRIQSRSQQNQAKLAQILSIAQSFAFAIDFAAGNASNELNMNTCQIQINQKNSAQQLMRITIKTIESNNESLIDSLEIKRLAEDNPKFALPVSIHSQPSAPRPRLIASLIIRNESEWFLERMLKHLNEIVDAFVIIDDDSDDNSANLCRDLVKNKNLTLVELKRSLFHEEYKLRRFQWELTQSQEPEWILCLDSDEFFDDNWRSLLPSLLNQQQYHVIGFRKYDMWNETHYRDDELWNAHKALWPHLVRNIPQINNSFQKTNQHCGRIPVGYDSLPIFKSTLKIKHYGSASPKIRERKFKRYSFLDPDGKFGNMAQYKSLMDDTPNLVLWT